MFIYDLNLPEDIACGEFEIVQQEEWNYLKALYMGGPDISVKKIEKDDELLEEETKSNFAVDEETRISTTPELCQGCRIKRCVYIESFCCGLESLS